MLPARDPEAESQFVSSWYDRSEPEALLEVVEEAMAARRPLLAARLVQLLPDQVEVAAGSALERALRASALLLRSRGRPEDNSWSELEEALRETRRERLTRVRRRQREAVSGRKSDFLGIMGAGSSRRRR